MKIAAHAFIAALAAASALAGPVPASALTPDRGPPYSDLERATTLQAAREERDRKDRERHQEYLRNVDRERGVNQGVEAGRGYRVQPDVDKSEPRIILRVTKDWNP